MNEMIDKNVPIEAIAPDFFKQYSDAVKTMKDGDSLFIEDGGWLERELLQALGNALGVKLIAYHLTPDAHTGLNGVRGWHVSTAYDPWQRGKAVSPITNPTDMFYYASNREPTVSVHGSKQNYTSFVPITKDMHDSLKQANVIPTEPTSGESYFWADGAAHSTPTRRLARSMSRYNGAYEISELHYLMDATNGVKHADGSWIKGAPPELTENTRNASHDLWIGVGGVMWGVEKSSGNPVEWAGSKPFPYILYDRIGYMQYMRMTLPVYTDDDL